MEKNIIKNFNDLNTFKNHLERINTSKIMVDPRYLSFTVIDGCLNVELSSLFNNGTIAIRETALSSILGRLRVSGKAWYNMSDNELETCFNVLKRQMINVRNDFVSLMVVDGCVNSINSNLYAHIPMINIIESCEEYINPLCNGEIKCEITSGYDITTCLFFTDKEFEFNKRNKKITIGLVNSESGDSACRIMAYHGKYTPIMNELAIVHRGETGMDDVDGIISQLDVVLNNAIDSIKLLEGIEIEFPITCTRRISEYIGIPQKYCDGVCEELKDKEVSKASEIFELFSEKIENSNIDNISKERYRNNLLKTINIDWSKFDADK